MKAFDSWKGNTKKKKTQKKLSLRKQLEAKQVSLLKEDEDETTPIAKLIRK
jgi:hypothetical protein